MYSFYTPYGLLLSRNLFLFLNTSPSINDVRDTFKLSHQSLPNSSSSDVFSVLSLLEVWSFHTPLYNIPPPPPSFSLFGVFRRRTPSSLPRSYNHTDHVSATPRVLLRYSLRLRVRLVLCYPRTESVIFSTLFIDLGPACLPAYLPI